MGIPILCDVDDTILDTQLVLIERARDLTGEEWIYDDMTRDYRAKEFAHNDSGEAERRVTLWGDTVREILKEPDTMMKCQPSDGALKALLDLHYRGRDVHIVSARQTPLHDVTERALFEHGFIEGVHSIHSRPTGERGTDFKVRVANEIGFEACFEDTFEVAVALAESEHAPWVYLIDKPWNRGYDDELPYTVRRVSSFAHGVETYLRELT